jgi:uracil-DNA glycosylase family 4
MSDGDPSAPLLIVGMAPGREELQHDKPFMGGSGKLLWRQLAKHGISRADCRIVNCIGEWPEGADGNPTKTQFDKWWDAFDEAVSSSQARVAFLLGRAALWRFTGITEGIENWRGFLLAPADTRTLTRTIEREGAYKTSNKARGIKKGDPKIEKLKAAVSAPWPPSVGWAVGSIHPAAVLRTGFASLPALAADAARVGRLLRGEVSPAEPKWHDGVPVEIIQAPQESVCVDIETGGINNGIITRIGASWENEAPWTALWDGHARSRLKEMLDNCAGTDAFNIGFDAPRLAAHGVPCPEPWWDVMLAAAVAQPDLKKSLNFVSSLYLDKRRHKHLAEERPAFYNAMDVADTRDLKRVLKGELQRTGQLDLFEKRMMPTLPVLVNMTTRGIKVDQQRRADWVIELTGRHEYAMKAWEQITPGMKTSGKRLLDWMYGPLGLQIQFSKHGGISSEVSLIKKLLLDPGLTQLQSDVLNTLLELRSVEKELRTYAEVELGGDGCVHPGFLPAGKDDDAFGKGIAGTGRITASGPNIQNQPQSARRMYIPHNDRLVLVEADFSQIEARIIAQLSGDEELKAAIVEGIHTSNMRVLGVDKTRAKNGFYGWAYGAGKRTLHNTFIAKGFPVSEAECEKLLRGFDMRFVKAAIWRRRIAAELATRYYLTNAFGRRRYFLGGSRDTPAGLDFHPQSCAADIMWSVLRPIEGALRDVGGRLLATIHDSILIECPGEAAALAGAIMKEIMERPWTELDGLVVPVELKAGLNWGAMGPLEEMVR